MRGRARFIVLEGGEGAGKSTQAALLSSWMAAGRIDHRRTREPGGTPVSEAIRSIVLARSDLDVPPTSELFLILAAQYGHTERGHALNRAGWTPWYHRAENEGSKAPGEIVSGRETEP